MGMNDVPTGSLGQRVKAAIARSRKTQESVEDEIGVSRGYLSNVINDKRGTLGADKAVALAAATGVKIEWIVTGLEIPESALWGAVPKLPPPLEQIEGYHDAEVVVARAEPNVPLVAFHRARRIHMEPPPERVTTGFLRGLVLLLAANDPEASAPGELDDLEARTVTAARRSGRSSSK